jgi:hypothetical protein
MKLIPLRARAPVQSDLFDATAAPLPLRHLQLHQDKLVDLLSQLLWQVAKHAAPVERLEDDDDQDQP